MATRFRTVRKNGKKRVVPIGTHRRTAIVKTLTAKQVEDMTGVGIRHPGSLTKMGYHISTSQASKQRALNLAVRRYGRKEVLRKLGELYRLDYNKPGLKGRIVQDIRYVSGGTRND